MFFLLLFSLYLYLIKVISYKGGVNLAKIVNNFKADIFYNPSLENFKYVYDFFYNFTLKLQ